MDVADTIEKESVRLLSINDTYIKSVYRMDRPFASSFGVFGHTCKFKNLLWNFKKRKKSNIFSYNSAHQSFRLCVIYPW